MKRLKDYNNDYNRADERREVRDALYEYNRERSMDINRQIITKGTKPPTDAEVEKKSGELSTSFIPRPISWETFNAFNPEKKKAWLQAMFNTYQGISALNLGQLFGQKYYRDILRAINDAGLGSGRGRKVAFVDKEKYEMQMLGGKSATPTKKEKTTTKYNKPIEDDTICNETETATIECYEEKPKAIEPSIAHENPIILSASFICDASQISDVLTRMQLNGKVKIQIESA